MPENTYITKKELHDEITKAENRYETLTRDRVMTAKNDLSKQLHSHITARFNSSKRERDGAHRELKDLITKSVTDLSKKIDPIAKNYDIVATLMKWLWLSLAFITVLFTALANARNGLGFLKDLLLK